MKKKSDIFRDFPEKSLKTKGEIVFEAWNTEKFRLRRAQIQETYKIRLKLDQTTGS